MPERESKPTTFSVGKFSHAEECMGTVFQFKGVSPLTTSAHLNAIRAAAAELHRADEIFSLYKPDSPLSRLERGEVSVAQLDPVVSEVWDACERWEKITGGWFSPFTPFNTFDPSGLVKTWAAEKAANVLVEAGIRDFTMNAGGDIWISDAAIGVDDFKVGISKPVSIASKEAGLLTVLDLKNSPYRAMATSGTAERGQHIWNPKAPLKAPANELAQVTVLARGLVEADIWATAAFAMGHRAIELLNEHNRQHPENSLQALAVYPIGDDGNNRLEATEGFLELFARPN